MEEIFICECSSSEHQIIMKYDKDDNCIYCDIHLSNYNFLGRLKNGIKYIFGYKSRFGAWDQFIITDNHTNRLMQLLNKLNDK